MPADVQTNAEVVIRKTPIEKIEEGIIDLLKCGGLNVDYRIEAFPADPDMFDLGETDRAALVQYSGSRYADPEAFGAAQMRYPEFVIHLYLRSVGRPLRAPYEIDLIRMALQNHCIEGSTLRILKDGLADQVGPLWHYVIEVAGSAIPAAPLHQANGLRPIPQFSKDVKGA
jgi:hypothetical protein